MPKPPGPPISIRLPEPVRNAVASYAAEQEIAFNKAIRLLVESGLELAGVPFPRETTDPASTVKPKKRNRKAAQSQDTSVTLEASTPSEETSLGAMKTSKPKSEVETCEHRVPLTSFCSRCAGLAF